MSFLSGQIRLFLLALGFLTRLAPARLATALEMCQCRIYFPLVGATLGLVLIVPFHAGLGRQLPWIQALLYVFLIVWLTRGFHLDGLADLADAWGYQGNREKFWQAIKDSRIGAFGTMALVFTICGYIFLAQAFLRAGVYIPLILSPLCSRCAILALLVRIPMAEVSSLGQIFSRPPPVLSAAVWTSICFSATVLTGGLSTALTVLIFFLLLLFRLHTTARKVGGANGDFIGALVCLGELGFLTIYLFTGGCPLPLPPA